MGRKSCCAEKIIVKLREAGGLVEWIELVGNREAFGDMRTAFDPVGKE